MLEKSQREAFGDAWKALKSVFERVSAPEPTAEVHDTPTVGCAGEVGVFTVRYGKPP